MERMFVIIVTLLTLSACDQSFNPKGQFQPTLVIYCALKTSDSSAVVKVSSTYNPPDFNPESNTSAPRVDSASVVLFEGSTAYSLRDTLIIRTDKSRYLTDIPAYVADPFPVEFGGRYSLRVTSPVYGDFSATMTMPTKAFLTISDSYVIDNPLAVPKGHVTINAALASVTRGYLIRAFIEYEISSGGQWTLERKEVPVYYEKMSADGVGLDPVFPELSPRSASNNSGSFGAMAFYGTAQYLYSLFSHDSVKVKRAVFVLNQVESNFYNYYCVVNGFKDKNSIRLDEPGFTNISRGEGVFGGFTVEEISHDLPAQNY